MKMNVPLLTLGILTVLGSGIVTRILGKPYHPLSFAVHKLIGILLIGWLLMMVVKKTGNGSAAFACLIVAAISAFALLISGVLLSVYKGDFGIGVIIHSIATISFLGSAGISLFMLK